MAKPGHLTKLWDIKLPLKYRKIMFHAVGVHGTVSNERKVIKM